jgi:LacI family transcriptional regulator
MATIKDVAARAGVSIGTVSNVLNGRPGVGGDMVRRVRAAMVELEYSPNGIARSLRGQRTRTIGLVVPDNANPFFAEASRAIERACASAGFALMLCNTGRSDELEMTVIELLIEKRVDGVIVAISTNPAALRLVIAADVPLVVIDHDASGTGADAVLVDHRRGGELAARHLVALGHRRFGCITGLPARASATRMTAFRAVLAESGLSLADDLIRESDTHADGGYRATTELLARDPEITAIFAANDLIALGAIRACFDLGRPVPGAMSVVGYDDISIASQVLPRLTTVRQPLQEIGRRAIDVVQCRITNRAGPAERWILPVEFVERESTAPPPGG